MSGDHSRAGQARRAARLFTHMLVLAVLAGVCAVFSVGGGNPLAVAAFPVVVAVYAARGNGVMVVLLVLCAVLAGLLVAGATGVALFYGACAATGIVLGRGMARHWTYGTIVTTVTGVGLVICGLSLWRSWDAWNSQALQTFHDIEAMAGNAPTDDPGQQAVQLALYEWVFKDHWADVSVGILFQMLLICVCLGVSFTSWWLRRRDGEPGPAGSFSEMRPPEWLVWVAIATALVWFADQRWPGGMMRPISWNLAIGLSAVYLLNGLGIVMYALKSLQPHFLVYVAVFFFIVYLGSPLLCFVGLFDTWSVFRAKVDRIVEIRKKLHEDSGDE